MGNILTQAALGALTPALKRRIPDAKVSGLHHVIQPSGARSWALRYRFAGRNTKLTIGPYPEIGLADARRKATVARAEIANGMDPARQKQEAKAEAKASEIAQALDVVETVARTYIATHSKVKTRPRTVRETERIIDHDILNSGRKARQPSGARGACPRSRGSKPTRYSTGSSLVASHLWRIASMRF